MTKSISSAIKIGAVGVASYLVIKSVSKAISPALNFPKRKKTIKY